MNATFTVTNTGSRSGTNIVPVYVAQPVSSVVVPPQRLVGFTRVTLDTGQSKTVTVSFPVSKLGRDAGRHQRVRSAAPLSRAAYVVQLNKNNTTRTTSPRRRRSPSTDPRRRTSPRPSGRGEVPSPTRRTSSQNVSPTGLWAFSSAKELRKEKAMTTPTVQRALHRRRVAHRVSRRLFSVMSPSNCSISSSAARLPPYRPSPRSTSPTVGDYLGCRGRDAHRGRFSAPGSANGDQPSTYRPGRGRSALGAR